MSYRTAARPSTVEEVVRNSRFLGFVWPVAAAAEVEPLIDELRRRHPDANHHCWAYRIDDQMRFSDDGEPGGTAGRPMLEVVLKRDLDRVAVAVVRYFGGVKLGAGGLVRAYSGAAAKALDAAGERYVEDLAELSVAVPYWAVDAVRHHLNRTGAVPAAEEYDAGGWRFEVQLPVTEEEEFRERLRDLTRGEGRVVPEV